MPISVSGTEITFDDATTQSTAAAAIALPLTGNNIARRQDLPVLTVTSTQTVNLVNQQFTGIVNGIGQQSLSVLTTSGQFGTTISGTGNTYILAQQFTILNITGSVTFKMTVQNPNSGGDGDIRILKNGVVVFSGLSGFTGANVTFTTVQTVAVNDVIRCEVRDRFAQNFVAGMTADGILASAGYVAMLPGATSSYFLTGV